jgi:hypothetical protein
MRGGVGHPNFTAVQTKFLAGLEYPCGRDRVVEYAADHGADDKVLAYLRILPNRRYQNPPAVRQAYLNTNMKGDPVEKANPIQMQKYLSGVDYPCDRDELVAHARSHGADDQVLQGLEAMPNRTFDGPNAVSEEYAKQS